MSDSNLPAPRDPAAGPQPGRGKTVLLLQGPPSPFWPELAEGFEGAGARVIHVNFCSGDYMFWRKSKAPEGKTLNYRGRLSRWPAWLDALMAREGVTDMLYFSDRMPYHAAAQDIARARGVAGYVVEFGYLRPGWLTLERGGMSAFSHFPNDPEAIRAIAAKAPPLAPEVPPPGTARMELSFELLHGVLNEYWRVFFPFYRLDRYLSPTLEYLSGLAHILRRTIEAKRTHQRLMPFLAGKCAFFLLPLQLQFDYQIRANTAYRDQKVMLDEVMRAFAAVARQEDQLLIKLHPFDPGLVRWRRLVRGLAQTHGIEPRVHLVDGGNLHDLLAQTRGVIVSNSTAGLTALREGAPVMVLGDALYDIAGLTHQGTLESFFSDPVRPDAALCDALVRALAATTQIRGSVYDPAGRKMACTAIVARVLEGSVSGGGVNGLGAFVDPPPRLSCRKDPFSSRKDH